MVAQAGEAAQAHQHVAHIDAQVEASRLQIGPRLHDGACGIRKRAENRQRLAGEQVTDEAVITTHPELMPRLADMLAALRFAEWVRDAACGSDSGQREAGPLSRIGFNMPPVDFFRGYELREEIGRGAMAVVYRAHQHATRREVAIKVMSHGPFSGPLDRARFEQEARILGSLRHPNVAAVHDNGIAGNRFYIVMDYTDGEPLDVYLQRSRSPQAQYAPSNTRSVYPIRSRLELFARVCDGVSAAHLRGIIHRDLATHHPSVMAV